jgi:N-acetyl-gamma-glutamyl-phosphate reductase
LRHGIISPAGIVINSLSGVSGAGRSASVEMSFAEINENVRAYKIGTHQHIPEIESVLTGASGAAVTASFVPHLIPITRGIYTTAHAGLTVALTAAELLTLYGEFYASHPFVRITREVPQILAVTRTNYCDIGIAIEARTNQLIVISVIDNLVKGAAGQAVQNMNLMFGLPEATGLK